MEYKRFGNTVIARIDRNEEILEQLQSIAVQENVLLAIPVDREAYPPNCQ